MAAKIFEVSDVLPATTQLKVTWEINDDLANRSGYITTTNDYLWIYFDLEYGAFEDGWIKVNNQLVTYLDISEPYEIIINTSSWNSSRRTVTYDTTADVMLFYWEDLNAPSGYTITFNSNGGSSVSDITEATKLPTSLPTPTKSGYKFVAWYYESNFQTRAKAGDTIEANTTLYAKWHNLGTLFTGIANAIRSKDGTSGNIRDLDFDDRIRAIEPAKEEQTKTVSPTTSSQDVLPDANKVLSKVTVNAIPTETQSQQPNLSSGDQTINATSGKFMTSFTITKDTVNHIASNIRSGTTLYGVTGNLQPAKEEETKTVTPNFSSGNVDVTPTSGKVMTQVTINKDSNLVAGNIKKDVTVHGITGTLESGGGLSPDTLIPTTQYIIPIRVDFYKTEGEVLIYGADNGSGLNEELLYTIPISRNGSFNGFILHTTPKYWLKWEITTDYPYVTVNNGSVLISILYPFNTVWARNTYKYAVNINAICLNVENNDE